MASGLLRAPVPPAALERDGVGMAQSRARFLKALEQEVHNLRRPRHESQISRSCFSLLPVSNEPIEVCTPSAASQTRAHSMTTIAASVSIITYRIR